MDITGIGLKRKCISLVFITHISQLSITYCHQFYGTEMEAEGSSETLVTTYQIIRCHMSDSRKRYILQTEYLLISLILFSMFKKMLSKSNVTYKECY